MVLEIKLKVLQFKSSEVALGSVESWRGSAGDGALGEMKLDPEE